MNKVIRLFNKWKQWIAAPTLDHSLDDLGGWETLEEIVADSTRMIKGFVLIGSPVVVSIGQSFSRNGYSDEELQNPDFYQRTIFPDALKNAFCCLGKQRLDGDKKGKPTAFMASPVLRSHVRYTKILDGKITHIIEYPTVVNYHQAFQFLRRVGQEEEASDDVMDLMAYNSEAKSISLAKPEDIEGIAEVAVLREEIPLRISDEMVAENLLCYFSEAIGERAAWLKQQKGVEIKGIRLSHGLVGDYFGREPEAWRTLGVTYLA